MQNQTSGDFLQWLRTFVLVAETGSIHQAAHILYISPPAASHHIRKLEQDLGIVLFNRKNRGMALTQSGLQFKASCAPILDEVDRLRNFREYKQSLQGVIRISCINRLTCHVIQDFIEFRRLHPHVTFSLESLPPGRVQRSVEKGGCDLGMTIYTELPGHLKFINLRPSSAYLYTQAGNPFHLLAQPTWDEICQLPFIALTLQGYVNPVISVLPEIRHPENVLLAVSDFLLALQLVREGMGVCIAPPPTPYENPDDYSLFNIDHIFPIGTFGLMIRRDGYQAQHVHEFISFMQAQYRQPHRYNETLPGAT